MRNLAKTIGVIVTAIVSVTLLAGCTQQAPTSEPSSSGSASSESSSSVSISSESSSNMSENEGYGPLQSVEYSNSGNMLGNMYRIETDYDEDGTLILREANSPQHDQHATIKEYRAPDDLLEQIAAIADEAGMKEWGDLPMSEFFPLDASTPTIRLRYENTDPDEHFPISISFTAYEEFPEGGEDAFYAVRDALMNCLEEENLIREYLEPERS